VHRRIEGIACTAAISCLQALRRFADPDGPTTSSVWTYTHERVLKAARASVNR
jgi:hypothetical protein